MTAPVSASSPSNVLSPWKRFLGWLDSEFYPQGALTVRAQAPAFEWGRLAPFISFHLACVAVVWVGVSEAALWTTFILYVIRMFAITAFYHRYFSHRTFSTSRWMQFVMAFWGGTAVQRGAVWWAANHRHHHRHSDEVTDLHSPKQQGFWWSHMGWLTSSHSMPTEYRNVPDLQKFPELVWLNRFDWVPPIVMFAAVYLLGEWLPGTTGAQLLVWSLVSTVLLWHGTWTINSLSHVWGSRRFETTDTSRNNFWLTLLTLGEGWHNNHHAYPGTVRQGFYWWEIDISYYCLVVMKWLGLVWDLHPVPAAAYERAKNSPAR